MVEKSLCETFRKRTFIIPRAGMSSRRAGVRLSTLGFRARRTPKGVTKTRRPSLRAPGVRDEMPDVAAREPGAESREPRAESRKPKAESREPKAESREPRA